MYDYSPFLEKLVDLGTTAIAVFIVAVIGCCVLFMIRYLWKDD